MLPLRLLDHAWTIEVWEPIALDGLVRFILDEVPSCRSLLDRALLPPMRFKSFGWNYYLCVVIVTRCVRLHTASLRPQRLVGRHYLTQVLTDELALFVVGVTLHLRDAIKERLSV